MPNRLAATPRANAAVIVLALLSGFWSEHGRTVEPPRLTAAAATAAQVGIASWRGGARLREPTASGARIRIWRSS
jgi:hypothetical protein